MVEFDLLSGCKLGGADALGTPVCISYSADGSKLYALLQVCLRFPVASRAAMNA